MTGNQSSSRQRRQTGTRDYLKESEEPGPDGCPFCGAEVPDNVALDQWGFFHCDDEECGARLRLDEHGRPYQRLAHLGIDIFRDHDQRRT